jgi:hypothetical protein
MAAQCGMLMRVSTHQKKYEHLLQAKRLVYNGSSQTVAGEPRVVHLNLYCGTRKIILIDPSLIKKWIKYGKRKFLCWKRIPKHLNTWNCHMRLWCSVRLAIPGVFNITLILCIGIPEVGQKVSIPVSQCMTFMF